MDVPILASLTQALNWLVDKLQAIPAWMVWSWGLVAFVPVALLPFKTWLVYLLILSVPTLLILLLVSLPWYGTLLALAVLSVGVLKLLERRFNVFQYLYFMRYSFLGALLFLTPFALFNDEVAARLSNLVTLTPSQVMVTVLMAAFATWSIIFSGEVAWEAAESVYKIPFKKPRPGLPPAYKVRFRPVAAVIRHKLTAGLVIALPLIVAIVFFSSTDGWGWLGEARGETRMEVSGRWISFYAFSISALGWRVVLKMWYPLQQLPPLKLRSFSGDLLWTVVVSLPVAAALRVIYAVFPSRLMLNIGAVAAGVFIAWLFRKTLEWLFSGWLPRAVRAGGYLLVTLTFYAGLYHWARPDDNGLVPHLTAVAYLLLLVILIIWVLSVAARFGDRSRVPAMLVVVFAALLLHQVFRADNVFELQPRTLAAGPRLLPPEAYAAWDIRHSPIDHPFPVVVAASGGGVGASYWTMYALTELEKELSRFGSSITLISGTSGGSLATALYVDAFQRGAPPAAAEASKLRAQAGTPTLAAVGWGLAMPGFLGAVTGGLWPGDQTLDRGWALEKGWERAGVLAGDGVTMGSWRRDVRRGEVPVAVLNGVVARSGAKLLISPMDLDANSLHDCGTGAVSFGQLFSDADVGVRTAVRLSSSTPWVLPLARPKDHPNVCYLGDGGYVDNSGVWSVVEYLKRVGPTAIQAGGRQGLILIQLRGYRRRSSEDVRTGRAWWWSSAGPATALYSASQASQPARDGSELDILDQHWRELGVPVHRFTFEMEARAPWFWGLTDNARATIDEAWCSPENRAELDSLKGLWFSNHPPETRPAAPTSTCR